METKSFCKIKFVYSHKRASNEMQIYFLRQIRVFTRIQQKNICRSFLHLYICIVNSINKVNIIKSSVYYQLWVALWQVSWHLVDKYYKYFSNYFKYLYTLVIVERATPVHLQSSPHQHLDSVEIQKYTRGLWSKMRTWILSTKIYLKSEKFSSILLQ